MMRRSAVKLVGFGVVLALISIGLAWVVAPGSWQTLSLYLLGAEFIFLLLLPGKDRDPQYGPHSGPAAAPLGASWGKIREQSPLQRTSQLVALPLIVAAMVVALVF